MKSKNFQALNKKIYDLSNDPFEDKWPYYGKTITKKITGQLAALIDNGRVVLYKESYLSEENLSYFICKFDGAECRFYNGIFYRIEYTCWAEEHEKKIYSLPVMERIKSFVVKTRSCVPLSMGWVNCETTHYYLE